jgi:hypothetical protein
MIEETAPAGPATTMSRIEIRCSFRVAGAAERTLQAHCRFRLLAQLSRIAA